jgi:hypothetical protein
MKLQPKAYDLATLQQILAVIKHVDPLARVLYGIGVEIVRAHGQVDLEVAIRADKNISISDNPRGLLKLTSRG